MFQFGFTGFILAIVLVVYFLSSAIKVLREYERGVVFRLGRLIPVKGPGLIIIWPVIDKFVRVDLRTVTMEVPAQDVITRDNISVKVTAVVYFRVVDPESSVVKVLDHTGLARARDPRGLDGCDLVLTTYGTLRRDILLFKDVKFDYAILDEAQAIKNAGSESARAARLLSAKHRLALSGTPIENHLGELWSLFEFLNPGMLGRAAAFRTTLGKPSPENRAVLARAVRPFILRRTKEQVARDLPAKTEQTISCELESSQRSLYDELRDHYRRSLLARVERDGIGRAKIQILEALLRLRQAACHPGLIDPRYRNEAGAKIETLLPQLTEVLEEGHKALVFSQFTSFLAILRPRLEKMRIPYEYLDGQTRDRAERVRRFQEDPACPLFLVSLKAGGLGLNLTAAEYVFLLDPWWNPAVEAQAVDRAHRIGQQRAVFAYRLVAKDTVEEKVLALQQTKRELADAILGPDNSLVRDLRREDLELLLS